MYSFIYKGSTLTVESKRKNKSDKAWLRTHVTNHYVQMAQKDGYRSRAAYKLMELDELDNLLSAGQIVVDLGCAPGSWSQVALQKVGDAGKVIGVDLLLIEPLYRLEFIHGDFTDNDILNTLIYKLEGKTVDLVISDMSPNLSGVKVVDQARAAYLIELVLDFCDKYLKSGGDCLIKIFHGNEFDNMLKLARSMFERVLIRKPDSSRSRSSETYLLCKHKI